MSAQLAFMVQDLENLQNIQQSHAIMILILSQVALREIRTSPFNCKESIGSNKSYYSAV
ncbi:15791_t:CDS:2 [Funneliformis caledonium]|uniref:15791_t:CDS:1 n=1 Tax=Funneliformis caledonium TaxID=1117310 RepID=A0A9N8VYW2_9GLOM|nr:15791_t:CDS:2 [Funneliformis caledonium]